ncbi:MAG: pyridoxine biosynthesis [Lasallia pustulata]|uniref:pyridoxal 5'-phosphate synthase (glutamine hydrolyzing) n=1 Tax=Lasallia pustulata TaxID=136370 RepID=A0A5M8PRL1_9LECA|nr:MAG: pyridoxine biosynthesis [Lasallia pustulata]
MDRDLDIWNFKRRGNPFFLLAVWGGGSCHTSECVRGKVLTIHRPLSISHLFQIKRRQLQFYRGAQLCQPIPLDLHLQPLTPSTTATHSNCIHSSTRARHPTPAMATDDLPSTNGQGPENSSNGDTTNFAIKAGLARMLKGGVIMDVVNAEQARIAEEAGACAVMALERVPADIRAQGGVARMSDPGMIQEIMAAVTIPVMAKARIGHFVECQILQALGVDYIDESEVLTPADAAHHVEKGSFTVPFVCGCRDLGEALRRIGEGAAMIRTKGEAGTGDVVEAVKHMRTVEMEIGRAKGMDDAGLRGMAKDIAAPFELLKQTARLGRLPVVNFAAGGVATPADAALMMQLGCDGVFVGSGIFKAATRGRGRRRLCRRLRILTMPRCWRR